MFENSVLVSEFVDVLEPVVKWGKLVRHVVVAAVVIVLEVYLYGWQLA